MKGLKYHLLDVFTNEPFGGNPLAVFPDADDIPTELMQKIANELNLSETTFIQSATNESCDCTVRIFTPKSEIPMAGHPTIGTAFVILNEQLLTPKKVDCLMFNEGVGPIKVEFTMLNGRPVEIFMNQPVPEFSETMDKELIAELLSIEALDILEDYPVQVVSCGFPFIVVPLGSISAVEKSKVRLDILDSKIPGDCKEVLVFTTEVERQGSDVHCRMFAPRFGIPEDPATGGAHGPLGSYLHRYGLFEKSTIVSEQGFEIGRPSMLTMKIESKDGDISRVRVGGDCVSMGQGQLQV